MQDKITQIEILARDGMGISVGMEETVEGLVWGISEEEESEGMHEKNMKDLQRKYLMIIFQWR